MVNKIINEFYANQPDGLIGNEDCGQMSAWYVLSAIGFYPVNPCSNELMMGSPQFESVKINFENGHHLILNSNRINDKDCYINSIDVKYKNQKSFEDWNYPSFDYTLFERIDSVKFKMGKVPSFNLGINILARNVFWSFSCFKVSL